MWIIFHEEGKRGKKRNVVIKILFYLFRFVSLDSNTLNLFDVVGVQDVFKNSFPHLQQKQFKIKKSINTIAQNLRVLILCCTHYLL